jgi:hypothetical protein
MVRLLFPHGDGGLGSDGEEPVPGGIGKNRVSGVARSSRPRLSKRPFRALAGGSLLEFPRPRSVTAVPWSVPAFLPAKASVGTPLLRQCPLNLATFNASPSSKGSSCSYCPSPIDASLATPSEILTQFFRKRSLLPPETVNVSFFFSSANENF